MFSFVTTVKSVRRIFSLSFSLTIYTWEEIPRPVAAELAGISRDEEEQDAALPPRGKNRCQREAYRVCTIHIGLEIVEETRQAERKDRSSSLDGVYT